MLRWLWFLAMGVIVLKVFIFLATFSNFLAGLWVIFAIPAGLYDFMICCQESAVGFRQLPIFEKNLRHAAQGAGIMVLTLLIWLNPEINQPGPRTWVDLIFVAAFVVGLIRCITGVSRSYWSPWDGLIAFMAVLRIGAGAGAIWWLNHHHYQLDWNVNIGIRGVAIWLFITGLMRLLIVMGVFHFLNRRTSDAIREKLKEEQGHGTSIFSDD